MKNQYLKIGLLFVLLVSVTFIGTVWQYNKYVSNNKNFDSSYIQDKPRNFLASLFKNPNANNDATNEIVETDEQLEPTDPTENTDPLVETNPDSLKEDNTKVSEVPDIRNREFTTLDLKILTQKGRVEMLELNGTPYIDINALAKYYGKRLGWDYENEQFISLLWGVDVRGSTQDRKVLINGKPAVLDEPVYIIGERTLIPINSLAKELGGEVTITDQLLEIKIRNIAKAASRLFRS